MDDMPTPQKPIITKHPVQSLSDKNYDFNSLLVFPESVNPSFIDYSAENVLGYVNGMLELMSDYHPSPSVYGALGIPEFNMADQRYSFIFLANQTNPLTTFPYLTMVSKSLISAIAHKTVNITTIMTQLPLGQEIVEAVQSNSLITNLGFAFAFIPGLIGALFVHEKEHGLKHQQIISGLTLGTYWIANALFDTIILYVPCTVVIILIKIFSIDMPYMWVIMLIFPLPFILYTYATTFLFAKESYVFLIEMLLNILLSVFMPTITLVLKYTSKSVVWKAFHYIFAIFPSYSMFTGIRNIGLRNLLSSNGKSLSWEVGGFAIYYLIGSIILFSVLLYILELLTKWKNAKSAQSEVIKTYPYQYKHDFDETIKSTDEAITTDGLYRIFKNINAVYNLNLHVNNKEIFSLLGVNGAGKTTTFRMLTSQMYPTRGQIFIKGMPLQSKQFYATRKSVGYCPQDSIIFDYLTVKEHLYYYAQIKGIPQSDIANACDEIIKIMDLQQYANKIASKLSGGNKRKLSVSVALIGCPPIVLLDEPTTGIDPKARRKLWASLIKAKENSTILLTTHSMEEAEALSDRIAIMVNGTVRCLGSSQQLKLKYGEYYVVQAKFKEPTTEQSQEAMEKNKLLKDKLYNVNEIVTILRTLYNNNEAYLLMSSLYCLIWQQPMIGSAIAKLMVVEQEFARILNSIQGLGKVDILEFANGFAKLKVAKGEYSISGIFKIMEEAKTCIDTYAVTESTLEQVFAKFALDSEKEMRGIQHD
jgi:ATP-binding cassette subfamily A (ABC1) protein 3